MTGSTQVTSDGLEKELVGRRLENLFLFHHGIQLFAYEASTAGGDTVPFQRSIANAILTILNDIAPDRSERLVGSCAVLYQDNCPLWVLPVLGRSPRRLGTLSASFSAGAATWSPDGKEIVYAPGNSLYRAKIDDKSRERSRAQPQAKLFTGLAGHLTGAVCVSALHRNSCRR